MEIVLAEHKNADEDDAIRYWAQIHLRKVYWMRNSDILDAFMHLYNNDKAKALDALVARKEKQAVENYIYQNSICELDLREE